MIHEGAVLITSADITRIDATSHSGRMIMKAPNVLVTSEQTQLTLRGLDLFVHGVTHNGIDLDPNQMEFNLDPRIWALRWCLPHPQLLAATASTHPQFTFLLPSSRFHATYTRAPARRHPTVVAACHLAPIPTRSHRCCGTGHPPLPTPRRRQGTYLGSCACCGHPLATRTSPSTSKASSNAAALAASTAATGGVPCDAVGEEARKVLSGGGGGWDMWRAWWHW